MKGLISDEKVRAMHLIFEKLRTRFDVLHAHVTYPPGYVAVKLKRVLQVPIVLTPHGIDIQKAPELNYGMRLNPTLEVKIKYAVCRADAVVSTSSSNKKDILGLGAPNDRVYDIPLGVETESFSVRKKNIRGAMNLSPDTQLILAVGVNRPRKGYPSLINAMQLVVEKIPTAKLMIVGRETKALLSYVEKANLKEYIFLLQDVSDEDKISYYMESDLFVFPSLMEGFGIVTLEAMAAGLPIVATNIPGSRDLVADGVNGFLVPPKSPESLAEKIILLVKNKKLRKEMGQESYQMARRYDWKIITKKYVEVYETVLHK